jgi:hypothetical protein
MYKVYQRSVRQTETFKDLQRIKEETQKIDMNEMIFSIKPAGNLIQKLNYCVAQSHYIEVVFIEQNMRFGQILVQLAIMKKILGRKVCHF